MSYNVYQDDELIAESIENKEYTVEGLEPNTQYSFSVSEIIGDNESDKTESVTATTLPIDVTSVKLSPKASTADVGTADERQLSAEISPSNATDKSVTYSIDDEEGLTVSDSGKIEWTADVSAGKYTTTVTTDDGSHTDTHVLTLEEPVINVDSVELSPSESNLEVDETEQLTATVEPSSADDTSVSYASDDDDVATVSGDGLVTAIGEGEVTITVTTTDGDHTDTSIITVTEPEEPEPDPEEGD